ncbi:MAG: outer membrane protein transport protein [Bacteroidota bacterium]
MKRYYFLALIFWFLLPLETSASPPLNLHGVRNLGMGQVGAGLMVDASTIYFNPGAAAFLDRNQLMIGSTLVLPHTEFLGQFPSLYRAEMDLPSQTPSYFYALFRLGKQGIWQKLRWGVAVNSPFLTNTRWPDDWAGNQLSQEFSLTFFTIQPTLSWRISPKVSIGLGAVLGSGSMLIRKALPENGPDESAANLQYNGSGNLLGFNAGIAFQPNDQLRIGLSYRSALNMRIDSGEARYTVPLSLSQLYPDGNFQTEIPLPASLQAGLSYKANERVMVVGEWGYQTWASWDSLRLQFAQQTQQVQDTSIARAYRNTWNLRLGAEFEVNEWVQLRIGAFYELTPVPEDFLSPEQPDANRIGLSAGLGLRLLKGLGLDLGYLYEYAGERSSLYRPAAFGGTYLSYRFHFGGGIRYQF